MDADSGTESTADATDAYGVAYDERIGNLRIAVSEIFRSTHTPTMPDGTPLYDGAFGLALKKMIWEEIAYERATNSWWQQFKRAWRLDP